MSDITTQLSAMEQQLANIRAQATAPVTVPGFVQPEPGYTTTEFWGTQIVNLLAVVAMIHPGFHAPPDLVQAVVLAASGVANAAYSIGRSWRKRAV